MEQEEELLESLLAVASEELEKLDDGESCKKHLLEEQTFSTKTRVAAKSNLEILTTKKVLKDTDIFQFESNLKLLHKNSSSVIHTGDTDSSDDEGNRNYEQQKYNQYGREVKSLLSHDNSSAIDSNSISSNYYGVPKKRMSTWKTKQNSGKNNPNHDIANLPANNKSLFGKLPEADKKFRDVFMDPIFGMRIVSPLISSVLLTEKMQGRLAVRYSDLGRHIFSGNLKDKDWVICAVVVSKSPPRTSNKGSPYSIWTLSDLKDDIKIFSLFLFNNAHSDLWKTAVGTVIGVLNPTIMDQKDRSTNEVSLSVNNAQKIMIFGHSKDFGICKSTKKNGDKCTAVVNLSRCEYCIYHIKQEYQQCSKRSELQANFAGQGLVNLRNKVLGKNEVFYAGKSYMAIPAKKSRKLEVGDQNILQGLNGMGVNLNNSVRAKNGRKNKKGVARQLDTNPAQRARDLKLLEKLGGTTNLETKTNFSGQRSDEITMEDSKTTALNVINKLKAKKGESVEHVNAKSDSFVNVEDKIKFSGIVSDEVSLEESKKRAQDVISKLKGQSKKNEDKEKKSFNHEDVVSIEQIEDQLNFEDLNYSEDDDEFVSLPNRALSISASSTNKITNTLNDFNISKSTSFINESTKSVINNAGRDKISHSPNSTQGTISTPKSVKNNESFGKITPKLSETDVNPNNFSESRKLVGVPKYTPKSCPKKHNRYGTPSILEPNNLNQIHSNDPKASISKVSEISITSINTLSNSTTQCITSPRSSLNKSQNGSKSLLSNKPNIDNMVMGIPLLSGSGNDLIDLSKPIRSKHVNRAKLNAVKFIQRNGPIKKVDPNSTKSSGGIKRNIESVLGLNNGSNNDTAKQVNDQSAAKKSKLQESEFISDRFKKMMAMTSKHAGLLEQHDDEEKEKYFKKLEIKEQMEEKMTNTHKVKCKAVRCLQCKYTSFSASELCKNERHPLKVFDAMKRFYKCSNCQNRTVTLELIPTRPCNNCGSSKWEKTGMMKEKIAVVSHNLSIRGGEQKFVNSVVADANLDLLVPDD